MESDNPDDEQDLDDVYLRVGVTEEGRPSGKLMRTVQRLLKGNKSDVKVLGESKVQVDLSYLNDPIIIQRTRSTTEAIIKTFISIPGRVETIQISEEGIFTFNVTNQYLSPDSDSSGSSKPTNIKKYPRRFVNDTQTGGRISSLSSL
ncbi:unnamed protein product [Arctia plantaginis]|uniref:Uncharacterized protein n=1 Tax=Arctia plantaginis TaxID=874455 RepID=A0A8S0ZJ47_ARCPL|nr:unnamed protein product [Arctia plantaginis]